MRKQKKIDPKMKIVNKNQVKDISNESTVFKTPETKNQTMSSAPQTQKMETQPQTQEIQIQTKTKKKRKMSAKQLENLAKGREKSLQNRREKKRLKEIEYAEKNGIPIETLKKTWTEKQLEKKYTAIKRKEKLAKYGASVKSPSQASIRAQPPNPSNPISFTPEMFGKYMNEWVASEQRKEQSRRRAQPRQQQPRQVQQQQQSRNRVVNHAPPISQRNQYRYSAPYPGLSKSQQANRGRHNGSSWGL